MKTGCANISFFRESMNISFYCCYFHRKLFTPKTEYMKVIIIGGVAGGSYHCRPNQTE